MKRSDESHDFPRHGTEHRGERRETLATARKESALDNVNGDDRPDADDYEVGYRKPPVEHRFKKGQSGNPKGRPKKAARPLTTAADVRRMLIKAAEDPIDVLVNGRTQSIAAIYAVFRKQVLRGAAGDARSSKLVFEHYPRAVQEDEDERLRVFQLILERAAEREMKWRIKVERMPPEQQRQAIKAEFDRRDRRERLKPPFEQLDAVSRLADAEEDRDFREWLDTLDLKW
jgi:hypothetical protein